VHDFDDAVSFLSAIVCLLKITLREQKFKNDYIFDTAFLDSVSFKSVSLKQSFPEYQVLFK